MCQSSPLWLDLRGPCKTPGKWDAGGVKPGMGPNSWAIGSWASLIPSLFSCLKSLIFGIWALGNLDCVSVSPWEGGSHHLQAKGFPTNSGEFARWRQRSGFNPGPAFSPIL